MGVYPGGLNVITRVLMGALKGEREGDVQWKQRSE